MWLFSFYIIDNQSLIFYFIEKLKIYIFLCASFFVKYKEEKSSYICSGKGNKWMWEEKECKINKKKQKTVLL